MEVCGERHSRSCLCCDDVSKPVQTTSWDVAGRSVQNSFIDGGTLSRSKSGDNMLLVCVCVCGLF